MPKHKAFYSKAFGWAFTDYGDSYSGIQKGEGGEMGGITTQEKLPSKGGPLVVLLSDDLEKSLAGVKAAGGTISTEIFEFPGGKRFHFIDPNGLELAVWTKTLTK